MRDELGDRIRANPKYQELVSKRNSYSWIMTILMLVVYYGYIVLVAFNKEFLAQKTGAGVTSPPHSDRIRLVASGSTTWSASDHRASKGWVALA